MMRSIEKKNPISSVVFFERARVSHSKQINNFSVPEK